jgi:hypothetical protein
MNLKNSVINSMREYPSISGNKLYVYDHLFLTIGNGYDWVNGELIEPSNEKPNVISIEEAIDKLFNNESRIDLTTDRMFFYIGELNEGEKVVKKSLQYDLVRYAQDVKTIVNAEKAVNQSLFEIEPIISLDGLEPECFLYPLSKYSKIMNIPDDIKPDWLDGIKELMDYLLNSDFPTVVEYRTKFENELNQVIERIEKLKINNGNNNKE